MQNIIVFWLAHPIIFTYLPLINLVAFIVYTIDKISATTHAWRVREKTMLLLALLGGSLGALVAMNLFRHKTKKITFQFWLVLILCLQVVLILYLLQIYPSLSQPT